MKRPVKQPLPFQRDEEAENHVARVLLMTVVLLCAVAIGATLIIEHLIRHQ